MARRRKGRAVTGILVLDKPIGPSSNQALQRVRHLFNAAKAGHTGNLDPLASGVLPICLGEATKLSQFCWTPIKRTMRRSVLASKRPRVIVKVRS